MKITIVSGARPNFMKIAPVVHAIDAYRTQGKKLSYRVIYTGTQYDAELGSSIYSDLQIKHPDAYLNVEIGDSIDMAAATLKAFNEELKQNPTDVVLVVDDLTTTMSCVIAAKKRHIKVAHITAGTRSFDPDVEKEANKVIIDGLSDFHFTAGMVANRNLTHTGAENERIFFVGNVLIDTLRANRNRLIRPLWFDTLGLESKEYLLLTINRHILIDNKNNFAKIIRTLYEQSNGIPIVAPLHSYVASAVKQCGIAAENLKLLPPQNYLSFGYLLNHAKAVITDSGNIAEEATFLGIPCITLNTYAEHPETYKIGTNELVGDSPEQLQEALYRLMHGEWRFGAIPTQWDGRAADRIVQILLEEENNRNLNRP